MVVNGDMRDRRNDHPQSFETCAHEGHAAPESGLMSSDNHPTSELACKEARSITTAIS